MNTIHEHENSTTDSKSVTFGWELIMDLYDCNLDTISSGEKIREYAKTLCKIIDMIPYGEPQIPYFGHNEPHTKGYSLVQLIETSAITGHFSEYKRTVYMNIFSCKPYDKDRALEFTKEFFGAQRVESHYITRI